ncbi:Fe(3+) ions import ATP-binding protein FbpC [Clostridia bacterium]|nr:Fe(3+) ions import ATP-binding protein FbpC [Clostridia bacterium]
MDTHRVVLRDVTKRYGTFTAVDSVSLTIEQGEFFTLLGPSGCGKTTLLRMIAGFNSIEEGDILFGEQRVNAIPAHKRDIGMVFQNYAIFPHLSVFDNVAYGLRARKVPKAELRDRVTAALELVRIQQLSERKPNELSGGQQQRVALARAFVIEPKVLLMDEPLSNLDAKLRVEMRSVIKKLQRKLNITTLYVTHDQEEALAISDRIAVMKDGRLMQVGTPTHIYKNPQNRFVAGFIGTSNFLECQIECDAAPGQQPTQARLRLKDGGNTLPIPARIARTYQGAGFVAARPQHVTLLPPGQGIPGRVELATFLGDFVEYEIRLENGQSLQLNVYTQDAQSILPDGAPVSIGFDAGGIRVFANDQEALSC